MLQDYLPLKSITCLVHISERMAEIMEEYKVTIKEEISNIEDTCTVFVVGEDVKVESTENHGIYVYIFINYVYIYLLYMIDFDVLLKLKLIYLQTLAAINIYHSGFYWFLTLHCLI